MRAGLIAGLFQACHIAAVVRAEISSSRRTRLGVVFLVAGLHVVAVLALIRAFAPDLTAQVTRQVVEAFTVTVTTPTPTPTPPPQPRAPEPEGAAAEAGKKAKPRPEAAPKPKVVVTEKIAPRVASTGNDTASGARDAGEGTGAGGTGSGTGSGNAGSGQGGGGASKAVKTSGDINSARDYPRASRDLRIGDFVTIALTVGADGRVKGCRVHRASRDPEADRITCDLATRRFRFRPATDSAGNPVESVYGWQQRWFYPGGRE